MRVRLPRVDFADAHAVALPPGASLDARVWHDVLFSRARGRFPVLDAASDEVVTGLDDRHLDFRVSVRADPGVLCVTTSVRFHGRLGRAYFAVVRHVRMRAAMRVRPAAPPDPGWPQRRGRRPVGPCPHQPETDWSPP